MSTPATSSPFLRRLGRSRTWPTLAFTTKAEPRYLLMVLALVGDSTMTRSGLLLRSRAEPAAGAVSSLPAPLAVGGLVRETAGLRLVFLLAAGVAAASPSAVGFLRAGTVASSLLLLCCGPNSLQSPP